MKGYGVVENQIETLGLVDVLKKASIIGCLLLIIAAFLIGGLGLSPVFLYAGSAILAAGKIVYDVFFG